MNGIRVPLFAVFLLASSLACSAATRLLEPDTPTAASIPPTPTTTRILPTPTLEASCPAETASILDATNRPSVSSGTFPNVDTGDKVDLPLVTYTIKGDTLTNPTLVSVPKNLKKYQSDLPTQQKAWDLFTTLIPANQRQMLAEYRVITDGEGNILGIVEQTSDNPDKWVLEVDIADIGDTKNLTFTLLHEFGHLLTLNASQVPPDLKIFRHPDSDSIYNQEAAACPYYFPGEGCSLPNSYMNIFFNRFWAGLYQEWQTIDNIQNDIRRQDRLDAFYQKYKDMFVDDYAVTDPSEDIAETWAYFVLDPRPQGVSVAEQKLLFFYQYPELTRVRAQILQNLCKVNP